MTMIHENKNDVIRSINRMDLRDIREVKIDPALSKNERIQSFISQIGNPYCYLDGEIVVSISYADTDVSLEDRLKSYACGLG
ncbi:MAG: hypothetical protein J6I45_03430 [Clostridia bacterium]|nr:hypothetical protein [Clostridia bacterium]